MERRNTTGSMTRMLGPVSVCLFLQCAAALAYPDLDWKLYDRAGGASNGTLCFYEEHTIDRTRRYVVRVWTKCVVQSDLDAAGSDHLNARYSRAVSDLLDDRRTYGYVLPILSAETLGRKEIYAAIKYEAVADLAGVAPKTMTFYDLDCQARRARLIGGTIGNETILPSGWKELPSKGSGARLRRLLCT